MKLKITWIALLVTFLAFFAQAQIATDTIQIRYNYGPKFYYKAKLQKPKHLLPIMKSNPEAHRQMKMAISSRAFGDFFGSAGGFLIGYALGKSIGKGKLNKRTLIAGGVTVALSAPISLSYKKRSVRAVKMYNDGLRPVKTDTAMLEFGTNVDGIGLKLWF